MRAHICIFALVVATPLSAQQKPADTLPPTAAPGAYRVLPAVKLYAGVAPGSEGWTIPESTGGQSHGRIVRNVVSPDYVPFCQTRPATPAPASSSPPAVDL